jgi:hypothetical protein
MPATMSPGGHSFASAPVQSAKSTRGALPSYGIADWRLHPAAA